jgi:hypothetical protein
MPRAMDHAHPLGRELTRESVWDFVVALVLAGVAFFLAWNIADEASTCFAAVSLAAAAFAAGAGLQAIRTRRLMREFTAPQAPGPAALALGRVRLGTVRLTAAADPVVSEPDRACVLERHSLGDWGDVSDEIRGHNVAAAHGGGRLLSVFPLESGARVCVVTERAFTTICLPMECREFIAPPVLEDSPDEDERGARRYRRRARSRSVSTRTRAARPAKRAERPVPIARVY